MASIKTALMLQDRMSPALRSVTSALGMVISNMQAMQTATGKQVDTRMFDTMRNECAKASVAFEDLADDVSRAANAQGSLNTQLSKGSGHADGLMRKIKGIVTTYAGMRGLQNIVNLSDTMASTRARLQFIVDDGGSVQALEDKIFAMSQRTRSSFMTNVDAIAKLGTQAGNAFSSDDELLAFSEQLNKTFAVSGTTAAGIDSVMYNLTQALSSGVLRGQDLNAVFSNAPVILQNVADYLDIDIGKIRKMAAEGQLSAEVIKNGMFYAADEINRRFEEMPLTWAQTWTMMKDKAIKVLDPILRKINEVVNSPAFQKTVSGLIRAFAVFSTVLLGVFTAAAAVGSFIVGNWSLIAPIIYGIATALALYAGYLIVTNGLELISKGIKIASIIASYAKAAATGVEASATVAAAAAQWGLNTALLACPVTWIIIAIIAIIAAIYLIVAAINKFAKKSISATGLIAGYFAALGANIYNGFIVKTWNAIAAFINFFANVFTNPIASIKILFLDLARTVIGYIRTLANGIESLLNAIPGVKVNITGGIDNLYNAMDKAKQDIKAESGYKEVVSELKYIQLDDAFKKGYKAGEWVDDKIGNMFSFDKLKKDGGAGGFNTSDYLKDISGDTSNIAGGLSDSKDMTDEELKYLRDIAERETINRFTTAEVKIDMTGMTNRIDSDMDIDGVISVLTEGFVAALTTAAEGVHA